MNHTTPILFDRAQLRKRRARLGQGFANHDFLWREATERAEESLALITHRFPTMVGFGTHAMEKPAGTTHFIHCADTMGWAAPHQLVADDEWLPFAESSVDAVVSILSLHYSSRWRNITRTAQHFCRNRKRYQRRHHSSYLAIHRCAGWRRAAAASRLCTAGGRYGITEHQLREFIHLDG